MNELLAERLLSLLTDLSQVTNDQMQSAYDCFVKQIQLVNQSESNYEKTFRMLSVTRVELVSLRSLYQDEQEKKCTEENVLSESNSIS